MIQNFICCGKTDNDVGCGNLDYFRFSGYRSHDRLLDGVWFRVSLKKNKVVVNLSNPEDEKFFSHIRISKKKILKEIKEYVENFDEDFIGKCPNCEGAVIVEFEKTTLKKDVVPVIIGKSVLG